MKLHRELSAITGFAWLLTRIFFHRPSSRYPRKNKPFILGHRGARSIAPENTLISFKKALALGADGVEFDVIMSRDKIPVIIHDDTLERTTNGHGRVCDYSSIELSQLDATKVMPGYKKEGVPNLDETLASLPDNTIVNIELKSEGHCSKSAFATTVMEVARKYKDRLRIIYSSFDGEVLCIIRKQCPDVIIGLLLSPRDEHWPLSLRYWSHIKPDALHIPHVLAKKPLLYLAHRVKMPIAIWTVNDINLAKDFMTEGVSLIFTDTVAEIIQAINCPLN